MSLSVSCPSCMVELEVPAGMASSVVDCPSCSAEFELEGGPEETVNPYQAPRGGIKRSSENCQRRWCFGESDRFEVDENPVFNDKIFKV